jgi:hypothetical protein
LQRGYDPLALYKITRVAHQDGDDGHALLVGRNERCGWSLHEQRYGGKFVGRCLCVTCIATQDVLGLHGLIEDRTSQYHSAQMQVHLKGGRNAEVATDTY